MLMESSTLEVFGDLKAVPRGKLVFRNSGQDHGTQEIRSGDLDSDGVIDAIILEGTGNVSFFKNAPAPDGWFYQGQIMPDTLTFETIEVGDMNNDGLLDIVGQNLTTLYLMLNNGSNPDLLSFTSIMIGSVAELGTIALGDMDNDGDLDIVHGGLGSEFAMTTRLLTNNGASTPSFSESLIYGPRFFVRDIDLVDLEGDGDLDIIMAEDPPLSDSDGVVVLRNQGGSPGTFIGGEISAEPMLAPSKVYGGDFDGDNDADILLLYNGFSPRILLLENNHPSFGYRKRTLDTGGDYGEELAIGDFDSDSDLDFVTGTTTLFRNTGDSPAFFRQDTSRADQISKLIHAVDFDLSGSIDLIRRHAGVPRLEFVENDYIAEIDLDTHSGLVITGNLELFSTYAQVYPLSILDVQGTIFVDQHSEMSIYSREITTNSIINAGTIVFNFINGPGLKELTRVTGDYQQYATFGDTEVAGTMILDTIFALDNIGGIDVQGTAELTGGLVVRQLGGIGGAIPADRIIGPVVRASAFEPGRDQFDVFSAPIISLHIGGGELVQGTVLPIYGSNEMSLMPVSLDELLFTQSPFTSEGTPNDAVLADVTGALDGTPDGDVDLIVAIPEIPGIAPLGAVAVFEGSLNVNGFEMVSVSVYTGPEVDAPGAVEVGFFDGDSIPDIAFANKGTNGNNNDIHFLHMDSSLGNPFITAPLPSFAIQSNSTVTDLATDQIVAIGDGSDDLLVGIQGNSGGATVQAAAFDNSGWESCEVDVDDIDTVTPARESVVARGGTLANVVISNPNSDTITYFVNSGDFENMLPIVIPTGSKPTKLVTGDLNLDGVDDLVVICEGLGQVHGVATIAKGLGNNLFAPPVNIAIGDNPGINPRPESLTLSDIDDDGDLDLVLVSTNEQDTQSVRVIRNTSVPNGGITFAQITDTPNQPAGQPVIVLSSDLDGDSPGIPDDIVVLVDPLANPARGSGASSNTVDLSGMFCAADLNHDSMLDFIDISLFVMAFSSEDSSADITDDGLFDFVDISAFVDSYLSGCPGSGS